MAALSHVKSDTIGDFTGTVTVFNSQGSTTTVAATNLVRPSDWNSAHNFFLTISGNTLGSSTMSGTNLVLGGTNGQVLSASTAAGAATLWITPGVEPGHHPYDDLVQALGQNGQGSLIFDPQPMPCFAFDRFGLKIQNTNSSNSSGSHTISAWVGLYTRNASSLSLLWSGSGSTAVTHSGTAGSYSLYSAARVLPFTVAQTTIPEDKYWIGVVSRTTSGGTDGTYSNYMVSNIATNLAGVFGSANNATIQAKLGQGFYSATTSGMPASVAFSQITGTGSAAMRMPIVGFHSGTV